VKSRERGPGKRSEVRSPLDRIAWRQTQESASAWSLPTRPLARRAVLDRGRAGHQYSQVVIRKLEGTWVLEGVGGLLPRHWHVLVRRYGLDHQEPVTLAESSGEQKMSRERVRQLQRQAELMLRNGGTDESSRVVEKRQCRLLTAEHLVSLTPTLGSTSCCLDG
jgi:hypothetical protein